MGIGNVFGNFYYSFIIDDEFCGLAVSMGKSDAYEIYTCYQGETEDKVAYSFTIQIGYGRLSVGLLFDKR